MDSGFVIEVTFRALWMAFIRSALFLISLLIVGLVIGIVQAATSVNESSVAFIPKLVVIAVVLLIAGPVSLALFVEYLRDVIQELPEILR